MNWVYVTGVVLLFGAGFWFGTLHEKARYEALVAANATQIANQYKGQIAAEAAKESAYEEELSKLRSDALTPFPTVPVRLCQPTIIVRTEAQGRQVIPPPAGVGAPNAEPVPQSTGPDYGPSLFGLADELDQVAAKCRAL